LGSDVGNERVPDGTTLQWFRLLLERYKLGRALFAKVCEILQGQGMKVDSRSISDRDAKGANLSDQLQLGKL
jgi:IS5 family transposase